jgi:hypothetical protein
MLRFVDDHIDNTNGRFVVNFVVEHGIAIAFPLVFEHVIINGDVKKAQFFHLLVAVSLLHRSDTLPGAIGHKSLKSVRFLLEKPLRTHGVRLPPRCPILQLAMARVKALLYCILSRVNGFTLELIKSVLA